MEAGGAKAFPLAMMVARTTEVASLVMAAEINTLKRKYDSKSVCVCDELYEFKREKPGCDDSRRLGD